MLFIKHGPYLLPALLVISHENVSSYELQNPWVTTGLNDCARGIYRSEFEAMKAPHSSCGGVYHI